jgi:hypothetical protein
VTAFTRHEPSELGIDHTELKSLLSRLPACTPQGPWLIGGSLRRLLDKEEPADIDFVFRDEAQFETFCETVAPLCATPKENRFNRTYQEADFPMRLIQPIKIYWYESLEAALDSFDYTICQFGWDGESVLVGPHTREDLSARRLNVHRLTKGRAVSAIRRCFKYQRQGFTPSNTCYHDILSQIAGWPVEPDDEEAST